MIAHLRGTLLAKHPNQAIVEAAGVGYDVTISIETFTHLPAEGSEVKLHIHTHVREDAIALFGFAQKDEKRLFEKLTTVSGIGPKLAITVLSGISSDRLIATIRAQDHATLTKVPGIGKKTAERVVLELKDKLDEFALSSAHVSHVPVGAATEDVLSALTNLGYQKPAAEKAMENALKKEPGIQDDFEQLFRATLAAIR
ncbi:Holliday junction branch migration protein RuvA [Terriglobus tenax]|uniref:Holliday junction branch migration protein RuvA n=1 Tax=Terriglobus tenax TaxID=1111115 RepID=UPI0021E0D88E|nr:Holliday junction branch migration protein RuvA [Terriglobus tenax]